MQHKFPATATIKLIWSQSCKTYFIALLTVVAYLAFSGDRSQAEMLTRAAPGLRLMAQVNTNDPNLQEEKYRLRQCQFSHNIFCHAEGDTNADELRRQARENAEEIDKQKKEYQEMKRKERADVRKNECVIACDKWFSSSLSKMRNSCRDGCK